MMLRVKNGVLEPRYFPVNGHDVSGKIIKHLFIDEMKDKWTTIIFHTKMGKAPGEGFSKMYVNDVLYNDYDGTPSGYTASYYLGKIKYDAGDVRNKTIIEQIIRNNKNNSNKNNA